MLGDRHIEKLRLRFPYAVTPGLARALGASDRAQGAAAETRLVESLLRFLSGLFLTQVFRRGAGDDRVTQFVDEELSEPSLERWIEFQRLLLDERRVPFEEVFSLDFKRRDLLLLLNKRYLDYLELLQARKTGAGAPENAGLVSEFVEFLATYFKSELVESEQEDPASIRLVNKDKDEVFALYPVVRGSLADLEVFSGQTSEGIAYFALASGERRVRSDAGCLDRFAELFLSVGAYRQAVATYEKLGRLGATTRDNPNALYASHGYLGLECYRKGKYHQAILEFEKALRLRDDLHPLHFNLALSHSRLASFDRAVQILLKLVESNPALDRAHELLGDLFQMKGDLGSARRMYDKAFLSNPYNKSVERKRRRLIEERPQAPREAMSPAAPAAAAAAPAPEPKKAAEAAPDPARVHELLVDLTADARAGRFSRVVGRETELGEILEILCCESRSNPLLIGEPGVGKTAIVEELALRLVEGRVPQPLRGRKLYLMSVATLLAGAKFRGQFEERVLALVQMLRSEPCILFIDDIHTIVNSGLSKGGTLDTSSLLKPALVRGEIRAIGATTWDEYRLNFEKDPSLSRSFQAVEIEEPTAEWMREILAVHLERLARHHGVSFEQLDLPELARLIKICMRERRLPDIAINVFDRAAARVNLRRLASAAPGAVSDGTEAMPCVRRDDVIEVVSEMSGIPVTRLSRGEQERFLEMERILGERVIGQEEAIRSVAQVIRTVKLNLDLHSARPDGVFLFVGPSGVGKTELARALAEFLFGHEDKVIRIDMSEYMEKISSSRLIGTAPGYVGYNDQNQLTDQVRKNPYSLVLLDEIEKADAQMLNLFLQVFDAGRLTDGKGRTVHFNNATMVMTSNVGTHLFSQARAGYAEAGRARWVGKSELMKEVRRYFPPEFLNRIDEIIFFRQLDEADLARIAALQLRDLTARLERQGVELKVAPEVYALLVREGASAEFGARNLSRTIRRRILDPLAVLALNTPWSEVTRVLVGTREGRIEVSLTLAGSRALEAVELPAAEAGDLEAEE